MEALYLCLYFLFICLGLNSNSVTRCSNEIKMEIGIEIKMKIHIEFGVGNSI